MERINVCNKKIPVVRNFFITVGALTRNRTWILGFGG